MTTAKTEARPEPLPHPVLEAVRAKLDERSLPVLRRTVGRVVSLASKVQTDIGELAKTILQDQSFSARLLAVANGAYYRTRSEPITTVTRAIVQVGYNTIRDVAVAAEFIDMAQQKLPQGIHLHGLIAKSLVAAHQAKALGEGLRLPDTEGIFTTSQLQSIGTLAVALYLPNEFKRIEQLMNDEGVAFEEACQRVLDLSPFELSEGILKVCNLPEELVAKAPNWSSSMRWNLRERKEAIVVFANQVVNLLLSPLTDESVARLNEQIQHASETFNVPVRRMQEILAEAFQKACSMGKSLGLDSSYFCPQVRGDGRLSDLGANSLIESSVAFSQMVEQKKPGPPRHPEPAKPSGSPTLLVNSLKDLSTQVMTGNDFNAVVRSVLEGLHQALGFDHALVLLMVPGKPLAVGRYGLGSDVPALLPLFVVPTDVEGDILAQCMAKRVPMRFAADAALPLPLPPGILDAVHPSAFALGPLCLPTRTVGLIWVDQRSGQIDDAKWDSFQLFVMQANLALLRLSTMH